MNPLRAAIVDDEPLARIRLRRLLARVGRGTIEVVAECVDADELLAAAARTQLDLLFLDIEMPGGDGFGALARWRGPRPQVVFVTAYMEHGVRAFDARATDYLVKPVSAERLRDTVERVRSAAPHLEPMPPPATEGRRLPLQVGQRTHLVPEDRIDLILAQRNYLEIHADGAVYAIRSTLAGLLADLDPQRFVQLHRSAVVRLEAISQIQPAGSARFRITLRGGQQLHSGRRFRQQVQALVQA